MNTLPMIEGRLGTPTFQQDDVLLYQGDCVELLAKLPPHSVHLAVTSPPYNIGKEYEQPLHLEAYLAWCARWIGQIHSAMRPDGAFWLNLGYLAIPGRARAIPIPYLLWDRVPFFLMQEIVWTYGAGVAGRRAFSPRNEKFLWYVKDQDNYVFDLDAVRDPEVKYPHQKKNGKFRCNPLGKNPGDVWAIPKVTSGTDRSSPERTDHPAQFPLRVIDRIIRACSAPGDVILDPFMGSGSTAEAAIRAGRRVVGFELSARYIDIAARRLRRVVSDLASSLFELHPAADTASRASGIQPAVRGSLAAPTVQPALANLQYPAIQT